VAGFIFTLPLSYGDARASCGARAARGGGGAITPRACHLPSTGAPYRHQGRLRNAFAATPFAAAAALAGGIPSLVEYLLLCRAISIYPKAWR